MISEHNDIDTDDEEEEEDGDDDNTQNQVDDDNEDSKSEQGSSDVTHGTTPYSMLHQGDDAIRYGPLKSNRLHRCKRN
jgi:hypothetical protein